MGGALLVRRRPRRAGPPRVRTPYRLGVRDRNQDGSGRAGGRDVVRGWKFVSADEAPRTDRGARHFVVNLVNRSASIGVAVHTLLDGTPGLTRWLDITNTSSKPVALTAVFPWSGRLWRSDAPISLGHSIRWDCAWEGWFGWTPLEPGTNVFKQDKGLVWDDPYFILRNDANGEYFFGQLAWPVN